MRVLLISNMDATNPYGAWTRPFYLGKYLAQVEEVFQVGFDCSDISYAPSISTRGKTIPAYLRAIDKAKSKFRPDVVYAHETFPGFAAYLSSLRESGNNKTQLVLDFHAASAYEYKMMLNSYESRLRALGLFLKAYFPQRFIASRGRPIIVASQELKVLVSKWYNTPEQQIRVVPNGARPRFINEDPPPCNPYSQEAKFILAIAPKNMMPNILSMQFTLRVAKIINEISDNSEVIIAVAGGGWCKGEIEQSPNVRYLGFVDNLMAYVDYADICLLPFPEVAVCGGARNKALDYFARGKLVLSTPEGLRGLPDFRNGEHVLVSSYDPREFAGDLLKAVEQIESLADLGENARILVKRRYNWRYSANEVKLFFMKELGKGTNYE